MLRLSDEDFKFVFERTPRLCIDLVIESDDGILLSLRNINPGKGLWHLPGGMVIKGESLQQAVFRIAKAETGLDVKIKKVLGPIEYLIEDQVGWNRHTVSIAYLLEPNNNIFKNDFQSSELRYFKQIPKEMYPGQADFLNNSYFNIE